MIYTITIKPLVKKTEDNKMQVIGKRRINVACIKPLIYILNAIDNRLLIHKYIIRMTLFSLIRKLLIGS